MNRAVSSTSLHAGVARPPLDPTLDLLVGDEVSSLGRRESSIDLLLDVDVVLNVFV
jgi:hypothetical protein